MTRAAKLIHRIENERYRPKFAEFEWLVAAVGFELRSRKGSHRSYRHPTVPQIMTIQPKGNMAQDYQVRDFLAKVRQHNLLDDQP
jgi:predicted RNA binding protein YcfA (HicA-like mRNA interferase family)